MQTREQRANGGQTIGQQGRSAALAKDEAPPHPLDIFREELRSQRNTIAHLIPRRIRPEFPPERIMIVAVLAYQTMLENGKRDAPPPDLYSTIDAVVKMAQLGLVAGTEQAYLVPYKGKVQAIIGPRGLIDLSLRHPKMRTCKAVTVLEGDAFDYDLGTDEITHKRGLHSSVQTERADALTHVWAKYDLTNGGRSIEVLPREDVEFYRSFSAARDAKEGPWVKNYEGMARKTGLKRLLAFAPRDSFLALALMEDGGGVYAPGLSSADVAKSLDSEERVTAQVPASLPQRQTLPAAEQMGDDRKSDPAPAGATRAARGYGDDADDTRE